MTSRISFSKLTFDELRRLTWLTAIQLLGFGILIPLRVLLVLASHANSVERYGQEKDYMREFCYVAGLGREEFTVFILLAGVFAALCVFGYLHSSVKLDFIHSLPVRRERMFTVKYLAGTLTFVIAYVLCQTLAVLIGLAYEAVNTRIVFEMIVASVQGILFFLCSFSGTLIAVMLTGKMLTSVFATAVLAAYVPVLVLLGKMLEACFLPNILDSGELQDFGVALAASPWTFAMMVERNGGGSSKTALTGPNVPMPGLAQMCQLVAMAALCTAIALLLYRIRRTEAAGSALAFRKTESVVKLLLAIPGALFAATVAYELFESIPLTVLFLVLGAVLCCIVMEFIYRWDIHQILSHKRDVAVTLAASSALFLFFYYDVAGINTYLPKQEDIAAMAVCENSLRYNSGYTDIYFRKGIEEKLTKLETENITKLYQLAENGVANTTRFGTFHIEGESMMVYMKFRLKNGREVYRNYWADRTFLLEAMDELLADEALQAEYFDILTWTQEEVKRLEGHCWLPDYTVQSFVPQTEPEDLITSVTLKADETWEIVQAYQRDLKEMPYEEYLNASGDLSFSDKEEYRPMGRYAVGEAFTETMELLQASWPSYGQ